MYPVSEAFLEAVKQNTRRYYWTGKITTKAGTEYEFGAEDIVKGSGTITAQCCGNTEIELGTVYAAELDISLFATIDRYALQDAVVEMFYHLRISTGTDLSELNQGSGEETESGQEGSNSESGQGNRSRQEGEAGNGQAEEPEYNWSVEADGIYETVPMGIFEVSEANRKVKTLEIKAYDYMVRFEKNFNASESIGNCYDFMTLCSLACGVALAQTREYIEALPNGTETLSIYPDNDIETYRDVLYYIGQVLGGFFVINRAGELELRKYSNTPTLLVEQRHRFSSSFSDFITRYTAVSSTNLRTQIAEYYALDPDDGLTMNLGVNPFLQFGLEETREELITNILNDIAVVNYVPFDTDTIGNPALDLGDILSFSGGQADSTKIAWSGFSSDMSAVSYDEDGLGSSCA